MVNGLLNAMMNAFARASLAIVGYALLHGAPAAAQQGTIDFTVSGNSTVRGWTCTVKGSAQVTSGSGAAARGFDRGVQAATITVPLQAFTCPEAEMREHLLEAMRATEFPQITFRLDGYQPGGQGAVANGSLTILDRTQPVSVPLTLTPGAGGVQIQGELPLDMTTYGVEPPVVMLGLLRVRPQIRIEFTGVVTP
jgi:polyisoprenoid-binding protein YceI